MGELMELLEQAPCFQERGSSFCNGPGCEEPGRAADCKRTALGSYCGAWWPKFNPWKLDLHKTSGGQQEKRQGSNFVTEIVSYLDLLSVRKRPGSML